MKAIFYRLTMVFLFPVLAAIALPFLFVLWAVGGTVYYIATGKEV